MYIPEQFSEEREDEIIRIINTHSLATLVANGNSDLVANHIPFLLDITDTKQKVLTGHVARNNPIVDEVRSGSEVLVIYQASDSYISPNWYPTKRDTHKQVPTWNYQAVHLYGNLEFIDDARFIRGVVGRLTKLHEEKIGETKPWKMDDAPSDYINEMINAVIGIKINITKVSAKSKLSQNKAKLDFENVTSELGKRNQNLANAMLLLSKSTS